MNRGTMSDEAFSRWCESLKPCRYCGREFVGPTCPCERDEAEEPLIAHGAGPASPRRVWRNSYVKGRR